MMRSYWQAFRKLDRNILLYMFYWCMISFAYIGVLSVLMNLYLLRLGYGPEFIGLMLGSGQLVWAVFALPAGAVGSRFGAKRAMVGGMIVSAAAMFLMLAAEMLPEGQRQIGLMLAWMLSWIGAAFSAVNSAPYLMSVTDDQTRGFAFSAQQMVMAVAGFGGSAAGGILPGFFAGQLGLTLEHPAPYRTALLLAPVAYLIGALVFARARPGSAAAQTEETPEALRAPVRLFLFLGLVIALQSFSEGTIRAFFNVYLDTVLQSSTELIGGIMGASQLLLILMSVSIPAVLARWGTKKSLVFTTFGLAVFIVILAWVPLTSAAALAYMGINAMMVMMVTARAIFTQEAVSPRWRTTVSATATTALALGWAAAAWTGGSLVNSVGFQGLFLLGAFSALLSAGLLLVRYRGANTDASGTVTESGSIAVTGKVE